MLAFSRMIQSKILKVSALAVIAAFASVSLADEAKPLQLAQTSDGFNAEEKYMASCFACHSTGAAGAPKVAAGTYDAEWAARIEQGMDTVMNHVMNGLNAMPAKGLCFDCTDADLRALVEYMIETSKQ